MSTQVINNEDIARRAKALYEKSIRAQVETPENIGRVVVIDPETGAFSVGDEGRESARRLHALRPGAPLYEIRIGYNAAVALGGFLERTDRK